MKQKLILSALLAASVFGGGIATAQEAAPATTGGLPGYEVKKAPDSIKDLERVKLDLKEPPFVHEHSLEAPAAPRLVEVTMEIEEKEIEVEPGVFMWAFAYNGSVPGPLIVVHEGDYVELTLKNKATNTLVHNIDFHASTGALGGGELTYVAPGQEVKLRWKAIKPGVHIYHCAPGGAMIPWHVVHGMNGAVVVLPKEGLRDKEGNKLTYDKAFYIGEQDFYIPKDKDGKWMRFENASMSYAEDVATMNTLIPTHIVFGERKHQYTGENAMTAKVGETVMIYHSQANRQSYPHLIGGHGEYVWERGNFNDAPVTDIETWMIAGGSAGAAMYKFKQPGTYTYLSHNLIEAVNFGALAHIKVDGVWDNDLMEQTLAPTMMDQEAAKAEEPAQDKAKK
ncbi:copper-containing nitrite reductase [Taylorella asinigenitalis]|uniref:Copper-containing nitrite reductase n=1 Tax=Taylorella asinigenitalis (strain MCE3) TaxID=1008459 RepID=G4QBP8_TAYAM|nr:copper-containing nitrite reductase [Taylorella asinigenitalis]AEP37243.1 Copper-containing nitrite reductase [Taylorella asinigenitalis MCE3]